MGMGITNSSNSSASRLNSASETGNDTQIEKTPNYDKAAKLLGKSADELSKKDPPKLKEMDEELREILQGKDGAKMEDELRQYMYNHRYTTISFATITDGNVAEIRTLCLPKSEGIKENRESQGLILNTFTGPSKDDCKFVQKKYTDPRDIEDLGELLSQPNTLVEKPVKQFEEPLSPSPAKKRRIRYALDPKPVQPVDIAAKTQTSIMMLTKDNND